MSSLDINEILNISIDIETGFKGFLLNLRRRLIQPSSQLALDLVINRLFRKAHNRLAEESLNSSDYPVDTFDDVIAPDVSPRELLEKILDYEEEHRRFYDGFRDSLVYLTSKETCESLIQYKEVQIRETKSILEEIGLARCLDR
jgi:hypothetical protein